MTSQSKSVPPAHGGRILRLADLVAHLSLAASVFCATTILTLILASVAMRYLLRAPFPFTEDIAGLLLFSQVALAVPATITRHEMISLDILGRAQPSWLSWAQTVVAAALLAGVCGTLSYGLIVEGLFSQSLGIALEVSDMPLAPWLYLGAFGFALSAACAVFFALMSSERGEPQ